MKTGKRESIVNLVEYLLEHNCPPEQIVVSGPRSDFGPQIRQLGVLFEEHSYYGICLPETALTNGFLLETLKMR